jgi:hypothetical protein
VAELPERTVRVRAQSAEQVAAAAERARPAVRVVRRQAVAAVPRPAAAVALVLGPVEAAEPARSAVLQALAVWPLAPRRGPTQERRPGALR